MKKIIYLVLIIANINLYAWEINTHRAINRKAIENSKNLATFLKNSSLTNYIFKNNEILFDGYGMTYTKYIVKGETNGISQWNQVFQLNQAKSQDLIEAGSILEDAQWQHFLDGGQYNYYDMADGRFVNHFYDAQNGGHALTFGYGIRVNALKWGTNGTHVGPYIRNNKYSYFKH